MVEGWVMVGWWDGGRVGDGGMVGWWDGGRVGDGGMAEG